MYPYNSMHTVMQVSGTKCDITIPDFDISNQACMRGGHDVLLRP